MTTRKREIAPEDQATCPHCGSNNAERHHLGDGEMECFDCGYFNMPIFDGRDGIAGSRSGFRKEVAAENISREEILSRFDVPDGSRRAA